jgi:hypothetical protein
MVRCRHMEQSRRREGQYQQGAADDEVVQDDAAAVEIQAGKGSDSCSQRNKHGVVARAFAAAGCRDEVSHDRPRRRRRQAEADALDETGCVEEIQAVDSYVQERGC